MFERAHDHYHAIECPVYGTEVLRPLADARDEGVLELWGEAVHEVLVVNEENVDPPYGLYGGSTQFSELRSYGFWCTDRNFKALRALRACGMDHEKPHTVPKRGR